MASSSDASQKDNASGINNSQINASANGDANANVNANTNANTHTTGRTVKRCRMNTDMMSKPPRAAPWSPVSTHSSADDKRILHHPLMMLNTFHYAGVSSKNVTLGVPRLKEIIVATKIKTHSLSVYLEPDVVEESMLGKNIQKELMYSSLRTVMAAVEIRYGPNPSSTIIEEDTIFVKSRSSRNYTCSLHGSFILIGMMVG